MTEQKVFLDSELHLSALRGRQIGIIGYGSQGRAQALNLRDSGFRPLIGVRPGKSFAKAAADDFSPISVEELAQESDIIMVLTPDETQPELCRHGIFPRASKGALVGFATSFNIHFGLVTSPAHLHLFLVAPKGPGEILRKRFKEGSGIPALVGALDDDDTSLAIAMAYAKAIGCGRAGIIKSSFREEAISDLFGEQCVLSGGMIELMKAAFEVLVENGYSPEVAYIECISEVEYMSSLISKVGIGELKKHISSTAYYGGATRGRKLIDSGTRRKLKAILREIEDGSFFEEFLDYMQSPERIEPIEKSLDILEQARANLKRISRGEK